MYSPNFQFLMFFMNIIKASVYIYYLNFTFMSSYSLLPHS